MSNDIEKEFEKYLNSFCYEKIEEVSNEVEEKLKENIKKELYENYSPNTYNRTYSLIDSITTDKSEKKEKVTHFEENKLKYTSAVSGEDVSMYVPKFVNSGHNDDSKVNNMYHHYPKRGFIDKTKKDIDVKYGKDTVEIIDNL